MDIYQRAAMENMVICNRCGSFEKQLPNNNLCPSCEEDEKSTQNDFDEEPF